MGNWTFDVEDDFTLPDGHVGPMLDTSNLERIHKDFAMECEGAALRKFSLSFQHDLFPQGSFTTKRCPG